jgi:hypothetical protein
MSVLSQLSDWNRALRQTATGNSHQESHRQPPKDEKHSRDAWLREMERAQVAHWFQGPIVGFATSEGMDQSVTVPRRGTVLPPTPGFFEKEDGCVTSKTAIPPFQNSPAAKAQDVFPNRQNAPSNCDITASADRHQSTATQPPHGSERKSNRLEDLSVEGLQSSVVGGLNHFRSELEKISGLTLVLMPDHAAPTPALLTLAGSKIPVAGHTTSSGAAYPQSATQTADCSRSNDDSAIRFHAQWQDDNVTVWLGVNGDRQGIEQRVAILATNIRRCIAARGNRLVKLVCNGQTIYEIDPSDALASSHYASVPMETTVHVGRVAYESAEQHSSVNHLTHPKETL